MTEVTAPAGVNPGKGLGIAAFIFAFFIQLVGLILGIVAVVKSRKAGFKNPLGVWAIILSIVFGVIGAIIIGGLIAGALALTSACAEYGPGIWETAEGVTLTCG